ncbi:hypothetical protein R7D93_24545, partial [Vibrio sp. YT-15]|uniref:hypothetical protein n=1 Tax=Vibrio sp. YT-15 TaxID=3074706 RepID=UPI002965408F
MTKQLVLAAVIATTSLASGSVLAMKNESTVSEYKPSISNFISPYISSVGMGNGLDGNGLGIRLGYKQKWPPIFGHDFKWSICFDSTQQYRDR